MFKVRLIKSKFILDFKLKSLSCFFFFFLYFIASIQGYKIQKKKKLKEITMIKSNMQ